MADLMATQVLASEPPVSRPHDWRDGLRDYQAEAVDAVLTRLPEHRRGTVVMACGSGKTIVSIRSADLLAGTPTDSVLVLAPSLALLDQLFRNWRQHSTSSFEALAVCSDDDLGASVDTETPALDATTDSQVVVDFLKSETRGPKVVFATYHSTPVIADATKAAGHEWSLAICDEAHRTAGTAGAVFTTVLSNAKVPCRLRLFLTASPRVHGATTRSDGRELVSMDNEALYGPRLFTYTFGRGIAEGWLADYRVLVLVIGSEDVYRAIHRGDGLDFAGRPVNATRAAGIVGLLNAAKEHDLTRVVAFHNTISASRNFANDLAYLAPLVDRDSEYRIDSYHLDGLASSTARKGALAALATPAEGSRVVVNNVRVLGEGVDIPALDGVMFAEPKSSQVDVIQAVGRAIRRNPDRTDPSVVIVPVYLAEGENPDAVMSGSTFKHVWQVLNALRDHDAALDSDLAAIRRNAYDPDHPPYEPGVLPDKVSVVGLSAGGEAFTEAITTLLLDHTTTTWAYGYDRFVEYHRDHGNGTVPSRYRSPDTQFPLGQWVQAQRQAYRWGRLTTEQVDQLEQAGFEWGQRSAQWRKNISLVETLTTGTGAQTAAALCFLAPSLGPWFRSLVSRDRKGSLADQERAELDALCLWAMDPVWEVINRAHVDDMDRFLLRMARQRRRGARALNVELFSVAAKHGLLTDRQRGYLARMGLDVPATQDDIDISTPGWEEEGIRYVASIVQVVTGSGLSTPRPPAPHKLAMDAEAPRVSLLDLVEHPGWKHSTVWERPVTYAGYDDVLPSLSELVTVAEACAGSEDDLIVRADGSAWRRATESDQWSPSGTFRHHVDEVVFDTERHADDPAGAPLPTDDLRDEILPYELVQAVIAAASTTLPDSADVLTHLVKSYGVKTVRVVAGASDLDEAVARALKRNRRVAPATPKLRALAYNTAQFLSTKLLRESLALTIPKVRAAYCNGTLDWPTRH